MNEMFFIDEFEDILNERGWRLIDCGDDETVELEWSTPAGGDFVFSVSRDTLVRDVEEYAESFSVDEYAICSYGENEAPGLRTLLDDGDAIKEELAVIAQALRNAFNGATAWVVTDDDCFQLRRQVGTTQFELYQILELPYGYSIAHAIVDPTELSTAEYNGLCEAYKGLLDGSQSQNETLAILAEAEFEQEAMENRQGFSESFDEAREKILAKLGDEAMSLLCHDQFDRLNNRSHAIKEMSREMLALLFDDVRNHPEKYPRTIQEWKEWLDKPTGKHIGSTF